MTTWPRIGNQLRAAIAKYGDVAEPGAAAGEAVVFGVIVGTGTGGGVAIGGEILTGPNAIAGEWGHNPLPWPRTAAGESGPPAWPGPYPATPLLPEGQPDRPTPLRDGQAGRPLSPSSGGTARVTADWA